MNANNSFWSKTAVPLTAALIGLGTWDAHAVSLGSARIQSGIGQALVAEFDLADISDEDSKALKVSLGSPAAFSALGLNYNSALSGAQIELLRRGNGNRYLKLVGNRSVNEPLVDVLIELNGSAGRISRSYTLLLDPPRANDGAAPATSRTEDVRTEAQQAGEAPGAARTSNLATNKQKPAKGNATQRDASGQKQIHVTKGDTAGKLALTHLPNGVSVEQMMLAILAANPEGFVEGNVNRLRAGVDLVLPDADVIGQLSHSEAQQLFAKQNQDYKSLRERRTGPLGSTAASQPTEKKPAVDTHAGSANSQSENASDKLTLSKDSVQDKAAKASVEQIARQRATDEAKERRSELSKNIEELKQLATVAAQPASSAAPVPPASQTSTAAAAIAASAPPPAPAASTPSSTKPVASESAIPTDLLALAAAVLAALAYGWYRLKRRPDPVLASFQSPGVAAWETRTNTIFESLDTPRTDPKEGSSVASSTMVYPESQMEVANELDPVAEAEVYLAYGKDVPAEEILREGLQQDPTRLAIHQKLLGIFAKRSDLASFEAMARQVRALAAEDSADWAQVQELGKSIDPSNPLYNPRDLPPTAQADAAPTATYAQSMFTLDTGAQAPINQPAGPTFNPPVSGPQEVDLSEAPPAATSSDIAFWDEKSASVPAIGSASPGEFPLSSAASLVPPTDAEAARRQTLDRLDATLALAGQFLELGEKQGAIVLLEEVIAQGDEALRARAHVLLKQVQ